MSTKIQVWALVYEGKVRPFYCRENQCPTLEHTCQVVLGKTMDEIDRQYLSISMMRIDEDGKDWPTV